MIRDEEVKVALDVWYGRGWEIGMDDTFIQTTTMAMRATLEAAAAARMDLEQRERDERLTARDQQ